MNISDVIEATIAMPLSFAFTALPGMVLNVSIFASNEYGDGDVAVGSVQTEGI